MGYRPSLRSLYWSWRNAGGVGLVGLVIGAVIGGLIGALIGYVMAFGAAIAYEVMRYKSIRERVDARDMTFEAIRLHLSKTDDPGG